MIRHTFRDFKIGCDPEFSFVMGERPGYDYYEYDIHDDYGYMTNWGFPAHWFVLRSGSFGREGNETGEVRPKPHESPIVVTARIHQILQEGYTQFPILGNAKWLSGGTAGVGPTGGHIHMSCTPWIDDGDEHYLVNLFDRYLLYGFNDLIMRPGDIDYRREEGFGEESDTRTHINGIEYRAMDSFLVNPKVTLAALSVAKIIFYRFAGGNLNSIHQATRPTTSRDEHVRWIASTLVPGQSQIPEDCKLGWQFFKELAANNSVDWDANMIDTWRLR